VPLSITIFFAAASPPQKRIFISKLRSSLDDSIENIQIRESIEARSLFSSSLKKICAIYKICERKIFTFLGFFGSSIKISIETSFNPF
ncbi:MAG TPA: hypothetical protein DIS75_06030, partial [Chryseobacterium sp.]|nr:hypothetical protein [Chryseobacterium sp.]